MADSILSAVQHEHVLRILAEQLKLPLLQIARGAEKAQTAPSVEALQTIETTADMALQLIDSYLLSVKLAALPTLELEPVSVSATLQDTAHALDKLARLHGCELELSLAGKYEPIMSHRSGFEAAFTALGYAFIEAIPMEETGKPRVVLGAHRSSKGLVAGLYSSSDINAEQLKRGRVMVGSARQPLPQFSAHGGAGVFVADSLFAAMNTRLHSSRHESLGGLAATLMPSRQLALV